MELTISIKKYKSILLSCLAFLLLTACGFHLRGIVQLPPSMQTLNLVTDNSYSLLSKAIAQRLILNHITLSKTAPISLVISDISFNQQTLSQAVSSEVSQTVKLTYRLTYHIEDKHHHIIEKPIHLQAIENWQYNINNLTASENEIALIKQTLQDKLLNQLMTSLSSGNIKQSLLTYQVHHEINTRTS